MLQAGSNPNVIEEIGEQSALHMAAERGFASIVELLIRNRSVLDANDGRGTPFYSSTFNLFIVFFSILQQSLCIYKSYHPTVF